MQNDFFQKYGGDRFTDLETRSRSVRQREHSEALSADDGFDDDFDGSPEGRFDDGFDSDFNDSFNEDPVGSFGDSFDDDTFFDDAPEQESAPSKKSSDGLDRFPETPAKRTSPLIPLLIAAELILALFAFPSSQNLNSDKEIPVSRNAAAQYDTGINNLASDALGGIFSMPKVYVLPMTNEPAPKPKDENYGIVSDSDMKTWRNTKVEYYEDETIKVVAWRENIDGAVYNFADVKIAHPSQIRRAYAGGSYGNTRYYPQIMAETNNAVIAITGDFYNYRTYGVEVFLGKLYKNEPRDKMPDVLFVDSKGNLSIEHCGKNFNTEKYLKEHDVMFSTSFGPALVKDGHILTAKEAMNYEGEGWIYGYAPRAAIGQLGELHYLLCTVDGKLPDANGTRSYLMAQVMADKGCYIAYNLDGGHTATLVFHNELFNRVAFGGQRASSDIIYFGTAIPEGK